METFLLILCFSSYLLRLVALRYCSFNTSLQLKWQNYPKVLCSLVLTYDWMFIFSMVHFKALVTECSIHPGISLFGLYFSFSIISTKGVTTEGQLCSGLREVDPKFLISQSLTKWETIYCVTLALHNYEKNIWRELLLF